MQNIRGENLKGKFDKKKMHEDFVFARALSSCELNASTGSRTGKRKALVTS